VGRLGSLWISAGFQIFALANGANVLGGEGNCPGGMSGGICPRGDVQGECFTLVRYTRCSVGRIIGLVRLQWSDERATYTNGPQYMPFRQICYVSGEIMTGNQKARLLIELVDHYVFIEYATNAAQ